MSLRRSLTAGALTVASAAALAPPGVAATQSTSVKVGPSKLGRILVDSHGKTLYLWAHDKGHMSTCNGQCAVYWPPLVISGKPTAGPGARVGLLGTSRRGDGRTQLTYHGHPLYRFAGDKKAGDVKGEGLTGFGARWDPVSPAGAAVRKPSASKAAYAAKRPLALSVLTPGSAGRAGAGGSFNVDLMLRARSRQGNSALSAANGYKPFFNDPSGPAFGPGQADPGAPGLVVLLSSTPTRAGTPLQGANTNLAGVFQLNTVAKVAGRNQTWNAWQVTSPGFFGTGRVTLTAYAVAGTAPGHVTTPGAGAISNVVRVPFTIGA